MTGDAACLRRAAGRKSREPGTEPPRLAVAVAPGEVYITNWLMRPYPVSGIKHPSPWERVEAKLLFVANVRLETYVGDSYFHLPPPASS